MKTYLSLLLSVALLISMLAGMAIPVSASDTANDILFTVSGGEATVTGYNGTATELTIPETLGGVPVKAVGTNAFENHTALTAVHLPATVIGVGECAFANCSALKTVTIGTVRTIEYSAFYGCDALEQVIFNGSETKWKAVSIAPFNEPLTDAALTCLGGSGDVSLLPADRTAFNTLSEGGGVIDVFKVSEGYRFSSWTGWPSAYTHRSPDEYTTVDVFSDTYLNFDFTVHTGYTNIILAFNGMNIVNLSTEGHYVTLNRLINPWYVDEHGTIFDLEAGTYTASVHVGALGCDPSLVTNGTFQISDIKIYSVSGASVTVRDLSIGEAKYEVWDLPQTSYTIQDSQTLLPDSAMDFAKAHTDTGRLSIVKNGGGMQFSSAGGWPCGYTKNYQSGDCVLADPDDYIYYDFTVYDYARTHIAIYFGGTNPTTDAAGTFVSLNPRIHPFYITPTGDVLDLPCSNYKGFLRVGDLGCSSSLMQDGKVPVSDIKVFAVEGVVLVRELAVVSIETYTAPTTPSTSTTTTTTKQRPITFSLSVQKAAIGETVTVDVTVSDDHYLSNGQLWIEYDPAALQLTAPVEEVNGAILDSNTYWSFDTPTSGVAKFVFANPNLTGRVAGGTLFSMTFTVLDGLNDETALRLTAPEMCSSKDGKDYDTDAVYADGLIANAASLKLGDVNLDGIVDLDDATRLFYHVNELLTLTGKALLAADFNESGAVDLDDAVRLFYHVNGLIK